MAMQSPKYYLNKLNNEAKESLAQLEKQYVPKEEAKVQEQTADSINAAHFSQGKVAAGFTSTVMEPLTLNRAAVLDEDVVKYSRVAKNGYVRIVTNFGPLNLELYCRHAPRACENFIEHCKNGYYDNTQFHRVIAGFIVQGGDPSGTGKQGESIWGKPFKDEIGGTYKHDHAGVLSMANRGTDTNNSQFFLTFAACPHLNGKHTVFGHLVGGLNTLYAIENVETDKEDRPLKPVLFMKAEVFVDPFEEAAKIVKKEREVAKTGSEAANAPSRTNQKPKPYSQGVGKYIKPEIKTAIKRVAEKEKSSTETKKARYEV